MAYFYVNKNAQDDGYHEVHNDNANCSHPPLPENRVRIGNYNSSAEAIAACKTTNPTLHIDGCAYCCPESHTR